MPWRPRVRRERVEQATGRVTYRNHHRVLLPAFVFVKHVVTQRSARFRSHLS